MFLGLGKVVNTVLLILPLTAPLTDYRCEKRVTKRGLTFLSILPVLLIAGIKGVYHHSRPLQKAFKNLITKIDNLILIYNAYDSLTLKRWGEIP